VCDLLFSSPSRWSWVGAAVVCAASFAPAVARGDVTPPPPPPEAPPMPAPLPAAKLGPRERSEPAPDPPAGATGPGAALESLLHAPVEPLKLKIIPPEASAPPPAPTAKSEETDYVTDRFEPAGLPLLGGDSDIGFQFGAVGTLSHFANGVRPYAWNMDLVASASMKDGPKGLQVVQESFLYNGDFPGLWGGRLRLNPQVQYQRTINEGYFGLGNAASGAVPANFTGPAGRYFQWLDSITDAYISARYTLSGPWSTMTLLGYRYMAPTAYADSKLARDAETKNPDGSPVVRGLGDLSIGQLATGLIYDTRDEEVFAHKGVYAQAAVAYQQGFPTSAGVDYGEGQLALQGYQPIGPFVLAGRIIADTQFGHVPFYDLFMAGPFNQSEAIGGGQAVRGVPVGRYSGEIKVYGTVEMRSMFFKFHFFKQKISLGADALFDTGRSWLDYSFDSPLDGKGVGLKYGVGGGIYVLWGQAALFRIDAAYSPDAQAENPGFPLGLYVVDGTNF
jgi:hypothetical protein